MEGYKMFMCPNCEGHFRVIWPDPLPSHYHLCSKIKMKCPDCGEVTELYDFLIDRIMCAPDPSIPTVEVLSISPRDLNPDPNARSNYWQTCDSGKSSQSSARCGWPRGSSGGP